MTTSGKKPVMSGVIRKHLELIEQSGVTEERLHQIHASGIFSDLLKAPHLDRGAVRKAFGYLPPSGVVLSGEKIPVRIDEAAGCQTLMDYYPRLTGWPAPQQSNVTYFSTFTLEQEVSLKSVEAELAKTHDRFPTPYEVLGGIARVFLALQRRATGLRPFGTIHLEGDRRFVILMDFHKYPGLQLIRGNETLLRPGQYFCVPSESEEEARSRHTHETCGND